MSDDLAAWRAMLAGQKVPLHESEPICGYFKMRDRRGLNMRLAPIKRPFRACAVWRGEDGELHAEFAGSSVPVERIWPFYARFPIDYATYQFWHSTGRWPE
jgi:hypothetical protein